MSLSSPSTATPTAPLKNIIFIGFMGTGKSTLARSLNQTLNYPAIDTDQLIEKQTQRKITEIFATDGEETFRAMETALLQSMIDQNMDHHLIATGGGIITQQKSRELLKELGFVVWLRATPEEVLKRTSHTSHRPLLQCENPMEVITDLMAAREEFYRSTSHLTIDTKDLALDEISCGILESARYHFAHPDGSSSDSPT
ncbi:MAG: shikimate kinase [Akkermansiaceae bacterium]